MHFSPLSSLRGWRSCFLFSTLAATASAALCTPGTEAIRQALQAGQLDQAARLVQQEKQGNPKDVQIRFLEGVVQAQQGQTDKAIDSFRKLTESNPELVEAYNNLGVLYAAKGRLDEARKALEAGMQANASYATLHRNLDDVQSQLTRQTYAKALQVDPKARSNAPQLSLLGSLEPRVGNPAGRGITVVAVAPTPTPAPPLPATPVASGPLRPPPPPPVAAAPSPAPAVAAASGPASVSAAAPAAHTAAASQPASAARAEPPKASASAPAASPPERQVDSADAEAVRAAVLAWAKAWSQKNMDGYLGAYADGFVPAERMSRSKWEAERRLRILSKKNISVDVRQLKLATDGKRVTAQFQQVYASDNFSGNSRKTLEMVKQGGRWLIARETVN